jgi:hypothetical protein
MSQLNLVALWNLVSVLANKMDWGHFWLSNLDKREFRVFTKLVFALFANVVIWSLGALVSDSNNLISSTPVASKHMDNLCLMFSFLLKVSFVELLALLLAVLLYFLFKKAVHVFLEFGVKLLYLSFH